MKCYNILKYSALLAVLINVKVCGKPAQPFSYTVGVRSDIIVTKWNPATEKGISQIKEEQQPGWMRRQLMNFGKAASRVGNMMGTHATKITAALDKVCEVIKTLIPLLAAICHVGQFSFCAATNSVPTDLSAAISPSILKELDR
ncbi:hypothetical protein WA026_014403 [Henosepilachna vigintioctopunctata]|uniref:Uncharacterized protein n=1 Tax=Henosepilachna vigintioctopunctata TaxID=420089 RepID=A0AAW1UKM1_9CUCU